METRGELSTCDIWFHTNRFDDFDKAISRIISRAISKTSIKIINEISHSFSPHGVTKLYILSASHLAYHTYPEQDYVSIDIYTCDGECDSRMVLQAIIEEFGDTIDKFNHTYILRGVTEESK